MNPLLSIIIVNYNSKEPLKECIKSLNKLDVSYEVIVVDNNSQDGSTKMIKRDFQEIILIENKKNLGFGKANNQGAKLAKGEFLLLANPDCKFIGGSVLEIIMFFNQNSRVGFVGPKSFWPDGRIQISASSFSGLYGAAIHHLRLAKLLLSESLKRNFSHIATILGRGLRRYTLIFRESKVTQEIDWIGGLFIFTRQDIFKHLGGFDEDFFMYYEDQDLALRGRKRGWLSYYFPSVIVEHSVGYSSNQNLRILIERYRSELMFWIKHYSWLSLSILRVLMAIDFSLRWLFTRSREKKIIYSKILKYVFSSEDYILKTRVV